MMESPEIEDNGADEEAKSSGRQLLIKEAVESEDVPKIYANGFTNFLSNADVGIVLQRSTRPVAVIYLSYTLAKTLHVKLGELISRFEDSTGQTLLTTDDVHASINRDE